MESALPILEFLCHFACSDIPIPISMVVPSTTFFEIVFDLGDSIEHDVFSEKIVMHTPYGDFTIYKAQDA